MQGPNSTDVYVSPQNNIDCIKKDACNGGGPEEVYPFYEKSGTVDETCNAWATGQKKCVKDGNACKVCNENGECELADESSYKLYKAESWGNVKGEKAMIEALQNGPLVCGVSTDPGMDEYFFDTGSNDNLLCDPESNRHKWAISHDIEVVGYGDFTNKNGTIVKYWDVRNSWSTAYGQGGFVKVCRGNNNILIETECTWVKPKLPVVVAKTEEKVNDITPKNIFETEIFEADF